MSAVAGPIIIRKKKVYNADGHHGGAWKVAYADFVTAMMAFFLLMWLLNATTEEQRKGIADYFNPNIPLAAVSGGGSDALSGNSIFAEETRAKDGIGATNYKTEAQSVDTIDSTEKQIEIIEKVEALNAALINDTSGLAEHIAIKMSPEGLVIELMDRDDKSLFDLGSAQATPLLQNLSTVIAHAFKSVSNQVKIVGHTDGRAFANTQNYSNWDLSTDRANTARRMLMQSGFPKFQISEVSGKAYTDPISKNKLAPKNRRISITILHS